MNKNLIIFSHHYFNEEIMRRYHLLKKNNTTWDLISIGFEEHKKDLINESIVVSSKNYPDNSKVSENARGDTHTNWSQPDLFLYEAYLRFPHYEKYFLIEYDTAFNCSIEDFFPNINTFNHFGNNVFNELGDWWIFYQIYKKYNIDYLPIEQCASIGQATCLYLDNKLISLITKEVINNKNQYDQMVGELRLGTLVKKFNKTLIKSREDISNFISFDASNLNFDFNQSKYFYHPFK